MLKYIFIFDLILMLYSQTYLQLYEVKLIVSFGIRTSRNSITKNDVYSKNYLYFLSMNDF